MRFWVLLGVSVLLIVVDRVTTWVAIGSESAREINPFVETENFARIVFSPIPLAACVISIVILVLSEKHSNRIHDVQQTLAISSFHCFPHVTHHRETFVIFLTQYLKCSIPLDLAVRLEITLSFDQELKPLIDQFIEPSVALKLFFPQSSFMHPSDPHSQSLSVLQQSIKNRNLPTFVNELQKFLKFFSSNQSIKQLYTRLIQIGWREGFDYLDQNVTSFKQLYHYLYVEHPFFLFDESNVDGFAKFLIHILFTVDKKYQSDFFNSIAVALFGSTSPFASKIIIDFFKLIHCTHPHLINKTRTPPDFDCIKNSNIFDVFGPHPDQKSVRFCSSFILLDCAEDVCPFFSTLDKLMQLMPIDLQKDVDSFAATFYYLRHFFDSLFTQDRSKDSLITNFFQFIKFQLVSDSLLSDKHLTLCFRCFHPHLIKLFPNQSDLGLSLHLNKHDLFASIDDPFLIFSPNCELDCLNNKLNPKFLQKFSDFCHFTLNRSLKKAEISFIYKSISTFIGDIHQPLELIQFLSNQPKLHPQGTKMLKFLIRSLLILNRLDLFLSFVNESNKSLVGDAISTFLNKNDYCSSNYQQMLLKQIFSKVHLNKNTF